MKKIFYGLLISLALAVTTFTVVLADTDCGSNCPPTKTSQPPPATETRLPPPTEITPTSPPEETATPNQPLAEPTPTVEVDPTPTDTDAPPPVATETPGTGKSPNKTPTPNKTMPVTGIGDITNNMPPNVWLGLWAIAIIVLLTIALGARRARHAR